MKRCLLVITCCFSATFLWGQTHKTDSLKHLIYMSKDDGARLKAMLTLCGEFENLPKDTLLNYAVKAKTLSGILKNTRSTTFAIIAQANAYLRWGNVDSARALVEAEIPKYKIENAATREIYFKLRLVKIDCIGTSYNYKDALADGYDIMREAEKYKDSLVIAESMNALSGRKYEMDFVPEAISMGIRGLSFTSNTPRYYTAIMDLCCNMSEYYYWINKLDSATLYADRALSLSKQTGDINYQSWALQKKSAIYIKTKEYEKAEKAILESIQLDEKVNGKEPSDDNLIALANVYERLNQFDKAIKVLKDGLAYGGNAKNVSPHAKNNANNYGLKKIFYYQELARCYRLKGDSKNYEALLERIIAGMDTFYKANSAQAIADFETKYQVQKKEATIAQQQLALVRGNYMFYGSVIIAALGTIIAFLIFREARRKQKLSLQQMQAEEKLLSERAVADAEETERRRIAADLHDNLGAQLSFIKRNVDFIMDQPAGFSQEDERKYLSSVNDIAQTAIIDLRETLWVLNKDEVSIQEFADKLKAYLKQQLTGKEMIQWDFKEQIKENWRLPSGEVMHLFRIVQEVISNIIKHAEAERINIQFNSNSPNTYQLEILDNGKGFDITNKYDGHYGLENIEQRAREISAALAITSNPEKGTRIVLTKKGK